MNYRNTLKRKKKLLNSWKQEKKHNRNRMAHLADRAIKLIEDDIKKYNQSVNQTRGTLAKINGMAMWTDGADEHKIKVN